MASSISTANIDATFPVAGQDNDSQGFRDNFSQIKTQFTTAASEITSLQANRAATNASTSFNGHDVGQAVLKDWSQSVYDHSDINGSVTLNLNDGNVHKLTTDGNITFGFNNWPKEDDGTTNTYAEITVLLTKGAGSHTISMPAEVKMPYSMGDGLDDSTAYTFPSRKSVFIFKFFSLDGGANVYMSNPEEYDASS